MNADLGRASRAIWPAAATGVVVLVIPFLLAGHSASVDSTIILALIDMVMVAGLYIFVGSSGVVSFGQVSFMAIGAYVCGMLTMPEIAKSVIIPNAPGIFLHTNIGTTTGVIIGGLVAAFAALVSSAALMRLSGIAASIGTLALLVITYTFFDNWQPGSSGGGNLTRIPTDLSVNSASIWAALAVLAAFAYQRSRLGLRLRAAREDEPAARAVGVRVARERRIAFVISGFMFGIAGGLYGHLVGSFSADDFFLPVTFMTLAMLVVGGSGAVLGVVCGTTLLSVVAYVFGQWENSLPAFGITLSLPTGTTDLIVAAVLILVLVLRPTGLITGELPWPGKLRRRPPAEQDADMPGEPMALNDHATPSPVESDALTNERRP